MNASPPLDPEAMPAWIASLFPAKDPVLAGAGMDDCGVLNISAGCLVVSTDFVNARPILSELGIGGLQDLGRILVATNLSDLCGSGANPIGILIGVMAERDETLDDFRSLMAGVHREAQRWHVPVLGGDTKLGARRAVYGVAIGFAPDPEHLFLKYRAEVGDEVWISGNVGDCSAATIALTDEYAIDARTQEWAGAAVCEPRLPIVMSQQASKLAIVNAGTDISDGLAADLLDVCRSSGVSVELEAERIPLSDEVRLVAERHQLPPWAFGLVLGGDFQFLITAPAAARGALERIGFVRMGRITDGPESALLLGQREVGLPDLGHRDGRRRRFTEELQQLLAEVAGLGDG